MTDVDGDGRDDVAVATAYVSGPPPHPGYVLVFLQQAGGGFAAASQYPVGPDPWDLAAGDLDGDGRPDLVAATPSALPPQVGVVTDSGGISILLQDAGRPGAFEVSRWVATGGAAQAAAIGALAGDAAADIVVADSVLANGRALLLEGDPSLPAGVRAPVALPVAAGAGSSGVALADLDNDGRRDLAVVSLVYQALDLPSRVTVLLQSASDAGRFEAAGSYAGTANASFIAAGDVDGDGLQDIVLGDGPGVLIRRRLAPGTFEAVRPLR